MFGAVIEDGTTARPARRLWHRLTCSRRPRCGFRQDRPGQPEPEALDGACWVCKAPWGSVSVYALDAAPAAESAPHR